MKASCEHEWLEKQAPVVCMWCGLPRVRTDQPRPRLKIPVVAVDRKAPIFFQRTKRR